MSNYEKDSIMKGDDSNVKEFVTEVSDEIGLSEESLLDAMYSTQIKNTDSTIYDEDDNNDDSDEHRLAIAFNDHQGNLDTNNTINEESSSRLFKFNSNDIFSEKDMFGLSEILTASEEHAPVMPTNYLEYIANSDPRVCFEMLHLGALLAIEKREKISFTSESELPRWNLPEVKIEESRTLRHGIELEDCASLPLSCEYHKGYKENEEYKQEQERQLTPSHENSDNNNDEQSCNGCFVLPLLQQIIRSRAPLQREEAAIDNLLTNPPRHELARVIGPNLLATLKRNTLHPLQGVIPATTPTPQSPPPSQSSQSAQTTKARVVTGQSRPELVRKRKREHDDPFTLEKIIK